jgi:hypothetical protein
LLTALALAAVYILISSQVLPAVVASHFAGGGAANGFMPRDVYIIVMLVMAVGLPLLLALLPLVLRNVPPAFWSLPNRDYWLAPERRVATNAYLMQHGVRLSLLIAAFLCFIHWLVVRANGLQPPHLSVSVLFAGMAVFLIVFIAWIARFALHFRNPR